jgi:hypothetical protein
MRRGGFRWTDPATAVASAMTVNVAAREYDVLRMLSLPRLIGHPINGWEMSQLLGWTTISTVPRLAPLRRKGMIEKVGVRPGPPPTHKAQDAYVITPRGHAFLTAVRDGSATRKGGSNDPK